MILIIYDMYFDDLCVCFHHTVDYSSERCKMEQKQAIIVGAALIDVHPLRVVLDLLLPLLLYVHEPVSQPCGLGPAFFARLIIPH